MPKRSGSHKRAPGNASGVSAGVSAGARMRAATGRLRKVDRQMLLLVLAVLVAGIGFQTLYATRGMPGSRHPLDARGLRIAGTGRVDASHVVPAAHFTDARVRRGYELAVRLPETLNQLYCWCGCIERGMRSNLECFESEHAAVCDVCLAGAEVAWELKERGITDPAAAQRILDLRYGRST